VNKVSIMTSGPGALIFPKRRGKREKKENSLEESFLFSRKRSRKNKSCPLLISGVNHPLLNEVGRGKKESFSVPEGQETDSFHLRAQQHIRRRESFCNHGRKKRKGRKLAREGHASGREGEGGGLLNSLREKERERAQLLHLKPKDLRKGKEGERVFGKKKKTVFQFRPNKLTVEQKSISTLNPEGRNGGKGLVLLQKTRNSSYAPEETSRRKKKRGGRRLYLRGRS